MIIPDILSEKYVMEKAYLLNKSNICTNYVQCSIVVKESNKVVTPISVVLSGWESSPECTQVYHRAG